jgi:hypothetical protein
MAASIPAAKRGGNPDQFAEIAGNPGSTDLSSRHIVYTVSRGKNRLSRGVEKEELGSNMRAVRLTSYLIGY